MTREQNWAGNYTFKAARIHRPASVDELRRLVAGAKNVRGLGTRHCFNGIADSPGDLVNLGGLDLPIEIDAAARTVTVGGGATYAAVARRLHQEGWALHNMASVPQISVAGAIATGTHGSGSTSGNLATAVAGLEIVTADGEILTVRRGDPGFDGMVVGLGAFGIVTRVTLDIQPTFDMRQDAFADLPWDALLANVDTVMSAAYSVSLFTLWSAPTVMRFWLKTHLSQGALRSEVATELGATPASIVIEGDDDILALFNTFNAAGPWSERMAHFQLDGVPGPTAQIQSELLVPKSQAVAALTALRRMGERIDPHLFCSEIRSVAGDELWLSPNYRQDSLAIHFTWKKEIEAVDAVTAEIEEVLLPLGARPHWGKVMHARAAQLAPLYPKMPAFRDLVCSHDPEGKFRNAFLNTHVFG